VVSATFITEAIIMVAAVVATSVFATTFMSGLYAVSDANKFAVNQVGRELKSGVKIVFAAPVSDTMIKVWLKNVGQEDIPSELITLSDVFFGPKGSFQYVPYGGDGLPRWRYELVKDVDNDRRWDPSETIEVTIEWASTLQSGDYFLRFAIYTGQYTDFMFSITR
jgi:archaellum component FlaF (FlaF/FlaG flagellin family)